MPNRETWATRLGFILAAVGSAVGLGNIWRFPFQVGQNGGAGFLVVYLAFVLVIGLPALLVEFSIGRRSERNPITAFSELGYDSWKFVGVVGVFTGFVIISYYTVVAGWVLRYAVESLTGAYFADPAGFFTAVAAGPDALAGHFLFVVLTAGIVAFGVQQGIELAVKGMVPAIIVLLLGLVAYGATLEGAAAGYDYYLSPDFGFMADNIATILPAAVGQALFTLSLGMGIMITYSSYLGEDDDLLIDGSAILALDTIIASLAGLIIFPVLFSIGAEPGEGGAGELFIAVGGAFAGIPFGELFGAVFFLTVAIAALSSAISIFEVVVSYLIDEYGIARRTATAVVGVAAFLAGAPTALDTATLELYDGVTGNFLLPFGMLLLVVFVGYVYADEAFAEIQQGTDRGPWFGRTWLWFVRTVVLLAVLVTLLFSAQDLAVQLGVLSEPVFP